MGTMFKVRGGQNITKSVYTQKIIEEFLAEINKI